MRDPNNIITMDYVEKNSINLIKINELPEYDIEDYDLNDEKDLKKYFNDVERAVRNSYEYRKLVAFLRDNFNMNKCSFYKNITNIDSTKIKIHIHHDPITLFDIMTVIFNKRKFYRESLDVESIAKEIMYVHYNCWVGLIPLAETVHELVHNMYLFVPTTKVYGAYKKFREVYGDFFSPEQIDLLDRIEAATESYEESKGMELLEKNYIYTDLTGAYELPSAECISNILKQRLEEIRSANRQISDYKQNSNVVRPIKIVSKEEK